MMKVNADLHIHSKHSAAVSKDMDLHEISREAMKKGVNIIGTGDCLHSGWIEEISALEERDGLFHLDSTYFALTVEIEDVHRVHHMILLPEIAKARELREAFASKSSMADKTWGTHCFRASVICACAASTSGRIWSRCA